MPKDTSLDDFVQAGGTREESDDEPADPSAVEPARSTYEWTPDGAACADCDDVVTHRWRMEGRLVCRDCKAWSPKP